MVDIAETRLATAKTSFRRPLLFLLIVAILLPAYLFLSILIAGPRGVGLKPTMAISPLLFAAALLSLNLAFIHREGWTSGVIGLDRPSQRLSEFFWAFLGGKALVGIWALVITVCMKTP